jgi:hypothetical protein
MVGIALAAGVVPKPLFHACKYVVDVELGGDRGMLAMSNSPLGLPLFPGGLPPKSQLSLLLRHV